MKNLIFILKYYTPVGYFVNILYGEKMAKKTTKVKGELSKKGSSNDTCHVINHHHPDHSNQKRRLSRVRGQLDGIDKMIDEGRYCIDIINQVRAAASALKALEKEIINTHIKSCVKTAIESKDPFESQEKIEEIMELF